MFFQKGLGTAATLFTVGIQEAAMHPEFPCLGTASHEKKLVKCGQTARGAIALRFVPKRSSEMQHPDPILPFSPGRCRLAYRSNIEHVCIQRKATIDNKAGIKDFFPRTFTPA